MKRYLALILSVLLVVSLLASCGGNGGETSSAPTPSESQLPTVSTDPTASTDPSIPTATDPTSGVATQPSVPMVTDPSITTEQIVTKPTCTITQPTTAPTTQQTPVITQAPPILTQAPGVTTAPSANQPTVPSSSATETTAPLLTPYKDAVAPLANSKYLLTKQNKLNVAYIGGSVTAGFGASNEDKTSWRALTTAWLKQTYPNANVTEINAARGGTGSYFAKHRLETELLKYKPDLVYIEFVINDKLEGNTTEQCQKNMEAIVRKCYQANPNMDIVFVYLTTVSIGTAAVNPWILGFNNVANQYGIETIQGGVAMGNSGKPLSSLFMADGVHPIDEGYAIIAQEVIKRTKEIFDKAGNPTSVVKHLVPSVLTPDLPMNFRIHPAAEFKVQNPSLAMSTQRFTGVESECVELKPGESFTFKFTGTGVGVYWMAYEQNEYKVLCTLDGTMTTQRLARFNSNGHAVPLFEGLDNGEHTLTFTYTGKTKLQIPMMFTTK